MSEKGSPIWLKKRGYYFFALCTELAKKYKTTPSVVDILRRHVIFHKKSYEDIFKYFAEKAYKSAHEVIPNTNTLATKVSSFLRTAKREQLDDITRLTKYDWDFEDSKEPNAD